MSLSLYLILYHINSDHLTKITVSPYEVVIAILSFCHNCLTPGRLYPMQYTISSERLPYLPNADHKNVLHFETTDFWNIEEKTLVIDIIIQSS